MDSLDHILGITCKMSVIHRLIIFLIAFIACSEITLICDQRFKKKLYLKSFIYCRNVNIVDVIFGCFPFAFLLMSQSEKKFLWSVKLEKFLQYSDRKYLRPIESEFKTI